MKSKKFRNYRVVVTQRKMFLFFAAPFVLLSLGTRGEDALGDDSIAVNSGDDGDGVAPSLFDDEPVTEAVPRRRPISALVEAQGTAFQDIPGQAGGLFFPPFPNYVGWGDDPDFTTFCLFDYAGLANAVLVEQTEDDPEEDEDRPRDLGTTITGSLLEFPSDSGARVIAAKFTTTNALVFCQSIPELAATSPTPGDPDTWNFRDTPTILGKKAADVLDGDADDACTGTAVSEWSLPRAGVGLPIPDLLTFVRPPIPAEFNTAAVSMKFTATCDDRRLFIDQAFFIQDGDAVAQKGSILVQVINTVDD